MQERICALILVHPTSTFILTHIYMYTDLQWEVGAFLLLSNLQAGQAGQVGKTQRCCAVLLFEVLHNNAIMCVQTPWSKGTCGVGEGIKINALKLK